ncbi:hypothetical protein JCM33374_g4896 [Metschnikowia sp. JCM 33374]|nr:hypothetical protein JCM33374_g4896 [Metschnikowia sp. JCM 33374]
MMMKFAPIAILVATFAAATPVPAVEWVTVTRYTTFYEDATDANFAFAAEETQPCTEGNDFVQMTAQVYSQPTGGLSDPLTDDAFRANALKAFQAQADEVKALQEKEAQIQAEARAAQGQAAQGQAVQTEAAQTEAVQKEAVQTEAAQPEAAQSEAVQTEAAQTEAAQAPSSTSPKGTKTGPSGRSVMNNRGSSPTSSTGDGVFAGHATYYNPGMGACGMVHADSDFIVAVGDKLYESYTPGGNPNENTLCGAKLIAHYEGKSVEVTVVDRCGSCSPNDLDLSPVAFAQIANQGLGKINLTWEWA